MSFEIKVFQSVQNNLVLISIEVCQTLSSKHLSSKTMEEPRLSDFKLFYEVERSAFATGFYASVRRARSRKTGQLYAAKFSPKRKENYNEIRLLSRLKNNFIITFKDAFVTDKHLITIMEFAPGGDLQSVIDADIVLPEMQASKFVTQLLQGLDYLHAKSIAHLDIKPQNLLLMGDFPNCQIKICDFELSRVVGIGEKEVVGTPDYIAPEVLSYTELTTKADIWSSGIVTYVLLTGFSPFGGDSDAETFNSILTAEIDFPNELFDDISLAGIDFIRALLEKNPRSRPTANFALSNDWLNSNRTRIKNKSKSSFDLSAGRTKSREKLMQRVVGAGLRKTMSKSREQLWRSKMQLSKSSDEIARWASVSEFPSLNDAGGGVTATIGDISLPEIVTKADIILVPNVIQNGETNTAVTSAQELPPEQSEPAHDPFDIMILEDPPTEQTTSLSEGSDDTNGATTSVTLSKIDLDLSADLPVRRSVKDLIQAFSRIEAQNLEVIDEEGEDSSGSWGRRLGSFRKSKTDA